MTGPNKFNQSYRDPRTRLSPQIVQDCVRGILKEAQVHLNRPISELSVLDVGCGVGEYSIEVAKRVRRVVGIEPDKDAFSVAVKLGRESKSDAEFFLGFIEEVRFDEQFDLAISLTTVEHMPNARRSFEHVLFALKPGGMIYLTAPNKLWPMECHYQLPFLSWLPLPLADAYLRFAKRGTSYQDCSYMRTYWGMKRLFEGLDCEVQFVLPDLDNSYIGAGDKSLLGYLVRRAGIALIRLIPAFWIISKAFLMVIKKKPSLKKISAA